MFSTHSSKMVFHPKIWPTAGGQASKGARRSVVNLKVCTQPALTKTSPGFIGMQCGKWTTTLMDACTNGDRYSIPEDNVGLGRSVSSSQRWSIVVSHALKRRNPSPWPRSLRASVRLRPQAPRSSRRWVLILSFVLTIGRLWASIRRHLCRRTAFDGGCLVRLRNLRVVAA
jgi:hypothetical protein